MKAKKGAYGLKDLGTVAMVLVGAVITIAFGAKVLNELYADMGPDDAVANATLANGSEALNVLGKWTPTIALIAVASIILGLVFSALYFGGK